MCAGMKVNARLLFPILIALAATISSAQPQAECPTIEVFGYPGIVEIGKEYEFSVKLSGRVPKGVTFAWEIAGAPIIAGRDASVVRFGTTPDMSGTSVTATVRVDGLPVHCTSTGSDFVGVGGGVEPIYLSSTDSISWESKQLLELFDRMEEFPSNQGYIFIGADLKTERPKEIEAVIRETALRNEIDQASITIIRESTAKEIVEFWRVPPGANNPLCRYCEPVPEDVCPRVMVSGPAGITNPGDSFHFTATIDKAPSNPIDYRWTVSTGSIVDGQGTDKIRVDVDWEAVDGITVTATVEVLGLAKECPNTYSLTAGVSHTRPAAVLEDEYSTSISRIDNARLLAFVVEMNKSPSSFAYVYEYFVPGTRKTAVRRKITRTKAALVKAGLAADRFKIEVVPDADQNLTRLYRVPPRADIPMP